ncbi:MAG: hypothetical protein M1829_000600 [Trizodia sp. TS-e1964]|nr:MAG: hypothetical protein M1829_000600 [Trizodia sp. TS-e1964]
MGSPTLKRARAGREDVLASNRLESAASLTRPSSSTSISRISTLSVTARPDGSDCPTLPAQAIQPPFSKQAGSSVVPKYHASRNNSPNTREASGEIQPTPRWQKSDFVDYHPDDGYPPRVAHVPARSASPSTATMEQLARNAPKPISTREISGSRYPTNFLACSALQNNKLPLHSEITKSIDPKAHDDSTLNLYDYEHPNSIAQYLSDGFDHSASNFSEAHSPGTYTLSSCDTVNITSPLEPPSEIVTVVPIDYDSDDEYPAGLDDINTLLKFAAVEEQTPPLAGLEYAFGATENSQSEEVSNGKLVWTPSRTQIALHTPETYGKFPSTASETLNSSERYPSPQRTLSAGNITKRSLKKPKTQSQICLTISNDFDSHLDGNPERPLPLQQFSRKVMKFTRPAVMASRQKDIKDSRTGKIRVHIPRDAPPASRLPTKAARPGHLLALDASGNPQPFARLPFPAPAQQGSPISGLSGSTLLRTCFRIGEALKAASLGSEETRDTIIELYARVSSSYREEEGRKQYFQFVDLFHNRPPFLNAVYNVWKGNDQWTRDSGKFLDTNTPGKTARALGRLKKSKPDCWTMNLLSIWEASWDDISYAKGIVCT